MIHFAILGYEHDKLTWDVMSTLKLLNSSDRMMKYRMMLVFV